MKKRFLSLFLTFAMLCAIVPALPVLAVSAGESPFSDVPTDYWAYDTIVTLTDAGVINGIGGGLFAPEDTLTRAEMTKLILCAAGLYNESINYHDNFVDVKDGEWYADYIGGGVAVGMYGDEYSRVFEPDSELLRGECAEWIINTLGVNSDAAYTYPDIDDADVAYAVSNATAIGVITGYEDGTYRPENNLTRAEAAAIVIRVMDYVNSLTAVREDSANEIVLNRDVKIAESSSTVNVPVAADEEECSVTFKNCDETLIGLDVGDVLYMDISSTLPSGLVGKIADVSTGSDTVTVWLEEPELEEVIESIDISAYFGVSEDMIGDDGEVEVTALSDTQGIGPLGRELGAVESKDNGVDFDADVDGEVSNLSLWYRSVYANADADITSSLHFETPSYAKKDGVYAAVDMSLGVMLDFIMSVYEGELNAFYISTNVTTNIESTAGYNKSGSKSASYNLPTINVPVAGVVNIVITSKLTVSANGEVSVVSNAELENYTGMFYSLTNGLTTYSYTFADSELSVDAEGGVKAGPELNVAVNLCKITIPLINKTIYDGFDIADASFKVGIGIEGELSRSVDVSVSNAGASVTLDDTDDEIHSCYFCVEGDIYYYYSGEAGLSDSVQKIFDKISSSGKKLRKTLADEENTISDWHLSTGDGYTNEFKLETCPHKAYKLTANVVVSSKTSAKTTTETISDANVTAVAKDGTETVLTEKGNAYIGYFKNGDYTVKAEKDGYGENEASVTIDSAASECTLELEEQLDYVKIYKEFFENTKFVGQGIFFAAFDDFNDSDGFVYTESEGDYHISSVRDAYIFDCDNDDIPELVVEAVMDYGDVYIIYEYDGSSVNKQESHLASSGGSGYSYTAVFTKAPSGLVYLKINESYHSSMGEVNYYGYGYLSGSCVLVSLTSNSTEPYSYFEYSYKFNNNVTYDWTITEYSMDYDELPGAMGTTYKRYKSETKSINSDYSDYVANQFSGYTEYTFGSDKGENMTKYYEE